PSPRSHPVDRHWPSLGDDGVTNGVEEVAVEQSLRQALTVVGRPHLSAEALEPVAIGRRDLGVHRVETGQAGQEILTGCALTARVQSLGSTGTADGLVK